MTMNVIINRLKSFGRRTALRSPARAVMALATVALLTCGDRGALAQAPAAMSLETYADPFDYASTASAVEHVPLAQARSRWSLCAVLPHVKDEYWLNVLFGMAEEARRLGVALRASETDGYRSIANQTAHLHGCASADAHAAILGSVTYSDERMDAAIAETARRMPVIAAVNDVASRDIAAKVGVSWAQMGARLGKHIAQAASCPARAVFATGPADSGWAPIHAAGLAAGLAGSCVRMVDERGADTNTREQLDIVEQLLERNPDVGLFVADAPGVEALLSLLRARNEVGRVKIFATYYTQAVRRGILRGLVEAAPFDDPVLQGRLAVEYAVRSIEGSLDVRQIGPKIRLITKDTQPPASALAPPDFRPEFSVR